MKLGFSLACLAAVLGPVTAKLTRSYSAKAQTQCETVAADGEVVFDPTCDSLLLPAAWQKPIGLEGEPDYDLIVIGGGIGGAYLINQIRQEFVDKGQPEPKIALYERAPQLGGRLVSAWGGGGLGLAVSPVTEDQEGALYLPLQEYGGMRIDPYQYPIIWAAVVQFGKELYGDENCLTLEEVQAKPADQRGENWCPGMLAKMNVGDIRYATHNPEFGILVNSTVFTETTRDYCPDAVAEGRGSPYTNCVQLGLSAQQFETMNPDLGLGPLPFDQGMETVCGPDCSQIPGLCDLCAKFPNPAAAIISCTGYDQPVTFGFDFILGLLLEVTAAEGTTHLNLIRGGFQRLVQALVTPTTDTGGQGATSPQLYRTLTGLSLEDGDVYDLAKAQVTKTDQEPEYDVVPTSQVVTAEFQDGSMVTAKAVYMTQLPGDMPMIEGLEAWDDAIAAAVTEGTASKIVFGWNDESKAPAALLNATPCVPGPCDRLILDGIHDDGWMIRQWWLWDTKTIMIYDVGAPNTADITYPATTMQAQYAETGMGPLVKELMDQFRNVTGIDDIEDPDWARYKPWAPGTFLFWNAETNSTNFAGAVSSPLGADIPVWYGNSEAAGNGELHGWAEGALDMVERQIQSVATYLGLEGDVRPTPTKSPYAQDQINELAAKCSSVESSSDTPVNSEEASGDPDANKDPAINKNLRSPPSDGEP